MSNLKEYAVRVNVDYMFQNIVAESYDEAVKIAMANLDKIKESDKGSPYITHELYSEKDLMSNMDALREIKVSVELKRVDFKIGVDYGNDSIYLIYSLRTIVNGFIYDLDINTNGGRINVINDATLSVICEANDETVLNQEYYDIYDEMNDEKRIIQGIVDVICHYAHGFISNIGFTTIKL